MVQYILECIAFQLVFLIIYDFFLKRETFFQWNRLYLIGTYILSTVLPWIKIEALKTIVPEKYYVYSEFLWNANTISSTVTSSEEPSFTLSWEEGALYGGMLLAAVYFGYKLFQIYRLRNTGAVKRFPNFTQIVVTNSEMVFSFFKYIFLGDKVVQRDYHSIIKHELVHIEQRHTWDLLFFELMRIVGWFNPLVYVYQNRVSELHEFIADAHVAKTDKTQQYQILLSQVFQTQNISFTNQFYKNSLIKKRIVMLQKSKSKRIWKLKILALVPILAGMLFYTSCEQDLNDNKDIQESISVGDVEHLTINEERMFFTRLIDLSEQSKDWELVLADENSSIYFSEPVQESSFISGPGGIPLKAKMRIESKVLSNDFNFFDNQLKGVLLKGGDDVPFAVIEEVPVFPGCENDANPRDCFQKMIQRHISKNFRYPQEAQEKGIQGRVSIMFTIDGEGNIVNIRKRGPDKLLEDEAVRIISLLPKMTPGSHEGKPANVPFSIPITFKLQQAGFNPNSQDPDNVKLQNEQLDGLSDAIQIEYKNAVPFATVENAPVFPGCENAADPKACFQEKIQRHIGKNFRYPEEAQEKGIQGRVSIMFLIDENGNITNIAKRGPDKLLEDEAERIIARLPQMQPGSHQGKNVRVPYSIPITFKLQ